MDEPLQSLRDIHLPPAVSWWPPAPGWWLLVTALLLLLALAWVLWRRRGNRRQNRSIDGALDNLCAIRLQLASDGDERRALEDAAKLLRRLIIARGDRQAATLHGEAWLIHLDKTCGGFDFSQGAGRVFAEDLYRADGEADIKQVLDVVERSVRLLQC